MNVVGYAHARLRNRKPIPLPPNHTRGPTIQRGQPRRYKTHIIRRSIHGHTMPTGIIGPGQLEGLLPLPLVKERHQRPSLRIVLTVNASKSWLIANSSRICP
jgi:hypothetical protein